MPLSWLSSVLFATDNEFLKEYDKNATAPVVIYDATTEEIEKWWRKGLLGKLHNFVVFIQRSVQREQHFTKFSSGLHLVRDNSTR